jgi:hypothetical protein
MATASERVSYFLRACEPLFNTEKAISFDPVQMAVLQRLVRESSLQAGVTVRKEDFFRAIVWVDYFTEVIAGRPTLFEDLAIITDELEKMHAYLDVTFELVVRYAGLFVQKEHKGERYFSANTKKQIERRHARAKGDVDWGPFCSVKPDLFYDAAARMVCDLVTTPEARALLLRFENRSDLRAVILVDGLLAVVPAAERPPSALAALQGGDLLEGMVQLLISLVRSCRDWSLRGYVNRIKSELDA